MDNMRRSGKRSVDEAENYIRKIKIDYEEALDELRKRVVTLRDENRALKVRVEEYERKEKYISLAIMKAEHTADTIVGEASLEAAKRLTVVSEKERKWQDEILSYTGRLTDMQRHIAKLLQDVVDAMGKVAADATPVDKTPTTNELLRIVKDIENNVSESIAV